MPPIWTTLRPPTSSTTPLRQSCGSCRATTQLRGYAWYGTAGRQPLTIKMLKELSQSLYVSKTHSTHDRLMLLAALAVAFFGFLRVSKFTVNSWKRKAMRRGRFLAKQDVLLAPYDLQLTIKYSKMDQLGKGSIITMGLTRSSLLSSP